MSTDNQPTRLNKYLALHLGVSRREADDLISSGKVTLNGEKAGLGAQVAPSDKVLVGSRPVSNDTDLKYVVLNKPPQYVCSRRDQGETPTIYALLPGEFRALKPVGRLDKDSSGILLMTNDGDFAHRMTHPSFHKIKLYQVELDKPLQPLHQQMISDFGVMLEDGKSQFIIEKLSEAEDKIVYQVTMSEGRNRQIRRTFSALGYTVTRLHRTQFGNYSLGDIKPGQWQNVNIS